MAKSCNLLTDMTAKILFTKRRHSTVVTEGVECFTVQSTLLNHCLPTTKNKLTSTKNTCENGSLLLR